MGIRGWCGHVAEVWNVYGIGGCGSRRDSYLFLSGLQPEENILKVMSGEKNAEKADIYRIRFQ